MPVTVLDKNTEKLFRNHVDRDPLDFFWFVYDWKLYPDNTRIWLASDDYGLITGLLLVHRETIIQFRGSRDAVRTLLEYAPIPENAEVQAPPDCEDLVVDKYGSRYKMQLVLMELPRGEENVQITSLPERLHVGDAKEIVDLLREADPIWWGEMTAEGLVAGSFKEALWIGIRQNDKLVSIGSARLTELGASNIGIIATNGQYRNRGYATSITSALVKEILKTSHTAIIHVLSDNAPAVRCYTKVGFRPYRKYLALRT